AAHRARSLRSPARSAAGAAAGCVRAVARALRWRPGSAAGFVPLGRGRPRQDDADGPARGVAASGPRAARAFPSLHARRARAVARARRAARSAAARARVLCLDEFMVTDIGDAMILDGLLRALMERGVTLVTTSNTPPRDLYRNGLQRERFLPAIALLEQHCEVLEIASSRDWRLRALTRAPVYLTPDDARAEAALARLFTELAQGTVEENA